MDDSKRRRLSSKTVKTFQWSNGDVTLSTKFWIFRERSVIPAFFACITKKFKIFQAKKILTCFFHITSQSTDPFSTLSSSKAPKLQSVKLHIQYRHEISRKMIGYGNENLFLSVVFATAIAFLFTKLLLLYTLLFSISIRSRTLWSYEGTQTPSLRPLPWRLKVPES